MKPRHSILFVIAFGAGLATGLSPFPALPAGGAGLAAALTLGGEAALVPLAAVLGLAHGRVARLSRRSRCPARLAPGSITLTVRLLEPGREGMVAAQPVGTGCRGAIQLRWPPGSARPAGMELAIEGRWIPGKPRRGMSDGVLLVREVATGRPRGGIEAEVRTGLAERAERLYGARAGLVKALVLGRRSGIDPRLRDAFAQAGLVHLLSISGFHVGLLAAWIFLALRLSGLARDPARLSAALLALGYVAFLGWPAPATRAAVLLLLLAWCRYRQRRVQPGPLLAITCLAVVLIDPEAVADAGAWLSAAAIWGVVRFGRWSEAALGRRWAIQTLFASLGATLATAPITALVFGTVALAGVALNFAAIPLAAVAVPGIFLSLVLPGALAEPIAGGTGLALAGLEATALAGGALPWATVLLEPGVRSAIPWAGLLALVAWSLDDRWPGREAGRRILWAAAAALWLLLAWGRAAVLGADPPGLTLHLLDVGQGDAAALRTREGRWVVIDAGPATERRDAGRRIVAPYLAGRGAREIALLVLSHAHLDHLGGAGSLLDRFRVAAVAEPAVPVPDSGYLAFLDAVALEGARWHPARRGDRWTLDGVWFTVLHPDTTWPGWREDLNEDSIVLLIEYGGFRALFTGDAGHPVEARLLGSVGRVDLLKVGHHGSNGSTGEDWLRELTPRAAVISVAGVNRYGHPHAATLQRLEAAKVPTWRTDREGTVRVWTDGKRVRVRGGGRKMEYETGR